MGIDCFSIVAADMVINENEAVIAIYANGLSTRLFSLSINIVEHIITEVDPKRVIQYLLNLSVK